MSYTRKLEELREAAQRKARELDEQFKLREKLEQGINTAGNVANAAGKAASDAARKGAEAVNDAAKAAGERAKKIDDEYRVTENLRDTAAKVGADAKEGAEDFKKTATKAAETAEAKAREFFGTAETFYRRAEQAYSAGTSGARIMEATVSGYSKAREWIKNNPGKTAVVTFSMIAGVRAGSALPTLGATILGAGGATSFLFHSSLPIIGLRKVTERYNEYLKEQERRIASGELDEAERANIEFQRDLTKYVGAPLLGAFSMAAGATMIASAFSGATATGFPISLILGGNPLLNGVWFFANGVICISEGYRFFMIALADEEDVQRVVREIKGLLPAATTAE
ncbi:MAG TPA: hypothetical protein VFD58_01100 [Blastocatellia bacterium]|nr:hypothetical protein [Blastocatellia bacterium]